MARWILKLTGYALLVGVFALCLYSVPPTIESRVLANAKQTLADHDMDWVLVSIDGRDITLSGTPPSADDATEAVTLLRETTGVRTVTTTWAVSDLHRQSRTSESVDIATIDGTPPASAPPDQIINLPVQQAPDQEFEN